MYVYVYMDMYKCISVCVSVYVKMQRYRCICIHVHVYLHMYIDTCMSFLHICIHFIDMYVRMDLYLYMYMYRRVCTCMRMCICIFIRLRPLICNIHSAYLFILKLISRYRDL